MADTKCYCCKKVVGCECTQYQCSECELCEMCCGCEALVPKGEQS